MKRKEIIFSNGKNKKLKGEEFHKDIIIEKLSKLDPKVIEKKAEDISIKFDIENIKKVIEEIAEFHYLIIQLPTEMKLKIISYFEIKFTFGEWVEIERFRILRKTNKHNKNSNIISYKDPFIRDCFGYFSEDMSKTPYFLWNKIEITDQDHFNLYKEENIQPLVSIIKKIKNFDKFNFNYARLLSLNELKSSLKNVKIKTAILNFNIRNYENYSFLDLSNITKLTIITSCNMVLRPFTPEKEYLPDLYFPSLKHITIQNSFLVSFESQDKIFNDYINKCLSKSKIKTFISEGISPSIYQILKNHLEIEIGIFNQLETDETDFQLILSQDFKDLRIKLSNKHGDIKMKKPMKFSPTLERFELESDLFMGHNIKSVENLNYISLKFPQMPLNQSIIIQFLNVCNQKPGIKLLISKSLNINKLDYKNIDFI